LYIELVELSGEWRRLHNEELHDVYCSPNIIRLIKSRIMRWAGDVARMGERRGVYRVLVRKRGERDYLEDPGADGRIILRWILRKWDVGVWTTALMWLRIRTGVGLL
jgi:predicted transcriptional regulator of viral defense system